MLPQSTMRFPGPGKTRLTIHDAAMRLIAYIVAKGTCNQEELDQFLKTTKNARFLFNEDVESYLRTLGNEALLEQLGAQKQEGLSHAPESEEFQKSVDAWSDRLIEKHVQKMEKIADLLKWTTCSPLRT